MTPLPGMIDEAAALLAAADAGVAPIGPLTLRYPGMDELFHRGHAHTQRRCRAEPGKTSTRTRGDSCDRSETHSGAQR
ncbi:hypothetical protein B4U45_21815 [Mycobacterium persicum]|uniref:Uncharacterized protein n=1 Tax=Mycobacterium persicum TaxID=1487726 RepID=A0A8E2LQ21_9MYCO|nr:hypothetical protein [Mycobacterium persicum]KZS81761.1 hypothetical protein A4G31_20485 [Mycobacterium persicum]ORB96673.1 hypothetical protein B1T44_21680 [Mycobacterium persicum]ORC08838.1 hypothetical protein B4U45_21815 [Mycobacterium persicum]VAZ73077.1 hypothetical protein LAUMK15_01608 [Mycobacterium persicum]VAZ89936.1 hypothetical protein LAUMK4_01246 [Mycobacterium persicum]